MLTPPRDFHKIGRERLHPNDLFRMIDWLRDGWEEGWDDTCLRYARLKWHVLELPERFRERAEPELDVLARAILVNGVDRGSAFANLRRLVSEWGSTRRAAA